MIENEWVGLMQRQSLFPFEVTMRDEAGNERFSFKVTKIESRNIDDAGGKLFAPPDGYLESSPPPF